MTDRDYLPPTIDWVRKQVEVYEGTNGEKGSTLMDSGLPCIIVTHVGNKTGGIRKIPLMRVKVDNSYVLIGSMGGQPKNPVWVYNLRANPEVQIRDKRVTEMKVREVSDGQNANPYGRQASKLTLLMRNIRLKQIESYPYSLRNLFSYLLNR